MTKPSEFRGSAKTPEADWQGGLDRPQRLIEQARLKTDITTS